MNRTVLVTGGAKRLGACIVRRLAAEGRRASSLRAFLTYRDAMARHPAWAAGIAARHGDRFDPQQKAEMHGHMSELIGRYSRAARPAVGTAARILEAARAAVAIPADDPLARVREAEALARNGDLPGAIDLARRVTAAAPRYAGAHHVLAGWLLQAGDFEEAAEAARRAADIEPDEAPFHERAAVAESRCGRPREAIAAAWRAVSCDTKNARRRDLLSFLYQRDGQVAEALDSLLKAIALEPGDPQRHKTLFRLAKKARYHGVALRAAETAATLLPGDAEAQEMLRSAKELVATAS